MIATPVEISFEKLRMAARFWLLGMANHDEKYYNVIDAMEYALIKHNGQRNGGDPEAIHQLRIFHGLRTLHHHLSAPYIKYAAAFLHDIVEDKNIPISEIETQFGSEVAETVALLSKEELGNKRFDNLKKYYDDVFAHEHASIVKLGDRNDNISTMVGVFKEQRLIRYYDETLQEFLPRIKTARRMFPRQEMAYENYNLQIQNQMRLIASYIELKCGDQSDTNSIERA